jgi:hypothetical protein
MRSAFLTASAGFGLGLQLISYPALAQTVAIPDILPATPPVRELAGRMSSGDTGPQLVCEPPVCAERLYRYANGVLVTGKGDVLATQPPITAPATKIFGGLSFGVGVGATFDIQGQQRVVSATAVNNIVRVSQTNNATVSLVGESHYFFVPNIPFVGVPAGTWGTGPFVAIDAGTNNTTSNIVTGFSLGWMIGFRQPQWQWTPSNGFTPTYTNTNSWNFGVGFRVDPNAQVLGDGVVANRPLPPGETTVRLKTEARYGIMLLTSFSF